MIHFYKFHGTGNDFIILDDRRTLLNLNTETIKRMCDRHFGIGADGLIQIRDCNDFDFEMLYYNSDGRTSSMCGNGGRCAVALAHSLGIVKDRARFKAFDGLHEAILTSQNPCIVKLKMSDVDEVENNSDHLFLNTGSPHYVKFSEKIETLDIISEGRKVRYSDKFKKEGTNVNFVEQKNSEISVRTYERGVEGETLSCGTGVTASVLASVYSGRINKSPCNVITPGGQLSVYFKRNGNTFSDIWLEGEAKMVFTGEYNPSV